MSEERKSEKLPGIFLGVGEKYIRRCIAKVDDHPYPGKVLCFQIGNLKKDSGLKPGDAFEVGSELEDGDPTFQLILTPEYAISFAKDILSMVDCLNKEKQNDTEK